MRLDSFGAIIKAAVVAGLGAGLLVAAVQFFWTEPVIDRAISLEEPLHAADNAHSAAVSSAPEQPVVDRPTQKKGLFLGYTIYGLAYGLLFGAAYAIGQRKLQEVRRAGRTIILAACSFWAVALLPFLKYPANPPGVGDPDTIDFRQHIYLGLLIGGIVVVALGFAVQRVAAQRYGRWPGILAALAFVLLASAALYAVLPANPDSVRMPLSLVSEFRLRSLAGLSLFWAALTLLFVPLLRWLSQPAASSERLGLSQMNAPR